VATLHRIAAHASAGSLAVPKNAKKATLIAALVRARISAQGAAPGAQARADMPDQDGRASNRSEMDEAIIRSALDDASRAANAPPQPRAPQPAPVAENARQRAEDEQKAAAQPQRAPPPGNPPAHTTSANAAP
jgi:hypothetical protein